MLLARITCLVYTHKHTLCIHGSSFCVLQLLEYSSIDIYMSCLEDVSVQPATSWAQARTKKPELPPSEATRLKPIL